MKVNLRLGGLVAIGEAEVALGQTYALLDAVGTTRSVSRAAERLGLSYRTAWGRLLTLEQAAGLPLVVKTKGHGSVLTERGAALRDALGATLNGFEASLRAEEQVLARRLAAILEHESHRTRLRFAVSHDPLLIAILAEMAEVESDVVGSQEAVERLLAGRADVAGFHAGTQELPDAAPFAGLARDNSLTVIPLFRREQGLILAPDNPLSIRGVTDLARTDARFVNRQRGSGTRLWLDRLLAEAGVSPCELQGYANEEFTHQAVAAVVASGQADVALGARSAAERFGLAFVPMGEETYFLAHRAGPELSSLLKRLTTDIASRADNQSGYKAGTCEPSHE